MAGERRREEKEEESLLGGGGVEFMHELEFREACILYNKYSISS
jgi:hypothetical protein